METPQKVFPVGRTLLTLDFEVGKRELLLAGKARVPQDRAVVE